MSEDLKKLFGDYTEGKVTRRDFIRKSVLLTGSLAVANTLLESLTPPETPAAMVDPRDSTILWHNVDYQGKAGPISGYLARPAGPGRFPGVVVIHENRGLDAHIEDVTRRLAKEGFVALAPDYVSRAGGTKKVNPKGGGIGNIREIATESSVVEDTASSLAYLRTLTDVRGGGMGVVGFCWGGGMSLITATQLPEIRAAVVYYGESPKSLDTLKNLKGPVLAHYAENDGPRNRGIPATEKAMRQFNKSYTYKIYPGSQHAFNNDTRADRYHPAAAKEAWVKTLEFLRKNLQS